MEKIDEHEKRVITLIEQAIAEERKPYIEAIKAKNFSKQELTEKLADAHFQLDKHNERNAGRPQSFWRDFAFFLVSEAIERGTTTPKPSEILESLELIRKNALTTFESHLKQYNDLQRQGSAKLTQDFIPSSLTKPISIKTVTYWLDEFQKLQESNPIKLETIYLRLKALSSSARN